MFQVTSWVGNALGAVFRTAAALRPAAKPLHPKGAVRHAVLHRRGVEPPVGVPFLDMVATDAVLVRESRSVGLPRYVPDIHGLALRVPNADGSYGDVLLATTGLGPLTRFLLTPSRSTYSRPMTTLLPYRTVAGPLLLCATAAGERRLALGFAIGRASWRTFAELELSDRESDDEISFDPVRNTLPGLGHYAATRRVREPAYAAARSTRSPD